ncbi:hypothetical protein BDV95DRAFT_625013 [Massariosphaeria phaeospora]|uniref:Gcp-like domain-containing protein n=1 Tax=Massariosphaeria phaeospora TaxID=100035 RepID=A0A7C8MF39_9PLEO|nr:hypothetical protein BDV95DRAFT_625013 [Massariosphaeria phaeospora]
MSRRVLGLARPSARRALLTLAIETSCDDTAVAILEKTTCPVTKRSRALLHFHRKVTSNNTAFHGVHPLVSLYSHQENLAALLDEAIAHLPPKELANDLGHGDPHVIPGPVLRLGSVGKASKRLPDFISVTRGPGMRSNLFTGLDTAKGLAVAWQRPLLGVHHMQAHALTPRLVNALQNALELGASMGASTEAHAPDEETIEPAFPFLSVLISGGHTLLIQSAALTDHKILASTNDIAVGECLDKIARAVLPPEVLVTAQSTMYGALLEEFAFPEATRAIAEQASQDTASSRPRAKYCLEDNTSREYCAIYGTRYAYVVPKNPEEASKLNTTKWGWAFSQPLSKAAGGLKSKSMEMSFSGLMTAVERAARYQTDLITGKLTRSERELADISVEERKDLAREAMRAAFEHIASRVVLGLQHTAQAKTPHASVPTVVVAGGVAANQYLRLILARTLVAHGYSDVRIVFPPASLCTDNAAMIAWAGIEMYEAGYSDARSIRAIRKWPLDQLLSPRPDE